MIFVGLAGGMVTGSEVKKILCYQHQALIMPKQFLQLIGYHIQLYKYLIFCELELLQLTQIRGILSNTTTYYQLIIHLLWLYLLNLIVSILIYLCYAICEMPRPSAIGTRNRKHKISDVTHQISSKYNTEIHYLYNNLSFDKHEKYQLFIYVKQHGVTVSLLHWL